MRLPGTFRVDMRELVSETPKEKSLPGSVWQQMLDHTPFEGVIQMPGLSAPEMLCKLDWSKRFHSPCYNNYKQLGKQGFEARIKSYTGRLVFAKKLARGRWFLCQGLCVKDLDPDYPKNFRLYFIDRKVI